MIPETAGALLAFLGLIAPGLVFEIRRERRKPPEKQTAFREAGRIALTSLVFTVVSLAVLVPLTHTGSWLPDLRAWLADPDGYLPDHYLQVTFFLVLHVLLSCALAFTVEELLGRRISPSMRTWGAWYHVFNSTKPAGTARVWLRVTLEDGTQFKGPLRTYTAEDAAERDIVLGGDPILCLPPGADPDWGWRPLDPYDAVIIDGSRIRHVGVQYLGAKGETLNAVAPPPTKSWLRVPRPKRPRATH